MSKWVLACQRWRHCVVRLGIGLLALVGVLGCNAVRVTDTVTRAPDASSTALDGWQVVAPGIQRRDVSMRPYSVGMMRTVRLDPATVTFRVHYRPDDPLTLTAWREHQPDAAVIVNGAFFDEQRRALGLLASDGQVYGQSFVGFGGMFQVTPEGVRVRSLVSEPYQGEPVIQALQAFPLLLDPGGSIAGRDDGFYAPSPRTWIGQDRDGRILIGVTHMPVSLAALQDALFDSDLNLDIAFALDGGRSSGLLVNVPGNDEHYPAFDRLPSVLAVYVP